VRKKVFKSYLRLKLKLFLLFLGTIRYIPDEEVAPSKPITNQKPKRNGNADSDSDEEVANLTNDSTAPRVNGHHHHRSGRKKSKSGRAR
jgi:hypothetical protein